MHPKINEKLLKKKNQISQFKFYIIHQNWPTVQNNYFSCFITVFIQHRKLGQTLPPGYVNQQARKSVTQSDSGLLFFVCVAWDRYSGG